MTKLVSRPEDQIAGSGPYLMRMTYEELQFIAAMLYVTRVGHGIYQDAVFKLLNTVEEMTDEDFVEESSTDVCASFSVLDHRGDIIEQHSFDNICIEV